MSDDTMKTASIDPFVLDFGSSVNISEELHRSIRTEIKGIDDDILSLQNEHKTEQRFYLQHRKDFSHALAEINRLSRDAREDLEQARVREHLLLRLRDSIEADVSTVIIVTPSPTPTDENKLNDREKIMLDDQNPESTAVIESDGFARNLGACAEKYKLELRQLYVVLKKDHTDCLEWFSKIQSLEEECNIKKTKVDELSKLCNEVSRQLEEIRRENDLEKKRVERLQECIEKEKQISAQYDEASIEQSKALITMKLEHQSAENHLNCEKEKLIQAVESLQIEYRQSTDTLQSSIEQLQLLEADVSALETLQVLYARLEKEHENVKEALIAKANLQLSHAQEFRREVDKLKAANNLEEEELVLPAREELKLINDQKENIAQIMVSLHEKIKFVEDEDQIYTEKQELIDHQLAIEYENNQQIIASRKAEQASIKQLIEDEKANFDCDSEAKLKLIESLQEKINDYQQNIENAKESRARAIQKRQDELRSEHQKRLEIERMKLQMYDRAILLMAESDEKVKMLRETNEHIPVNSSNKRSRNPSDELTSTDEFGIGASHTVENKPKIRSTFGRNRRI